MNIPRRNFLNRSLLGLLSLGFLPTTFSLLTSERSPFSINGLLNRLSFQKKSIAPSHLNLITNHLEELSPKLKRNESPMFANKTLCIQETNQITAEREEKLASIFQHSSQGYKKVVSLNHAELLALNNMTDHLNSQHKISEPQELKKMLVPVLRTKRHKMIQNLVESDCYSPIGYYTENGYCSIKIHGQGSHLNIQTSLLNFNNKVTHRNSLKINNLA